MDGARNLPRNPALVAHMVCRDLADINWEYVHGFVLCLSITATMVAGGTARRLGQSGP